MENRLSSSGIFSQDVRHCRSSRRSRKTCKIETLNLKILKIESSSCQCSMTLNGQREEIQNNVCQIPNKSRITRRDSRDPRSWRRKEVVWNSQLYTWRKMGFRSHTDGGTMQRNRSLSISTASVLWVVDLKRKSNRDTIHFNADAANTELLFRTIHSANQLSVSTDQSQAGVKSSV